MVKTDAAKLLEAELSSPKWKPQVLVMSGVTDPYQPVERKLRITRGCLEVLAKFRNPVAIITKNRLVTRDIDLLGELARYRRFRGECLRDFARSETATRSRTAHFFAARAPGSRSRSCAPPEFRSA